MKTFLYHENGWRMFQAEKLPVKPPAFEFLNKESYHARKYESEIAALKAKSIPVGNVDFMKRNTPLGGFKIRFVGDMVCQEWPGDVEIKEEPEYPIDHTSYPPYRDVAYLKS